MYNMAVEIERKFIVDTSKWHPQAKGLDIRQGYICSEKGRTVRVRTKGEKAFLTIKGPNNGISRAEYEYEIPVEDANAMLDTLCAHPLIEKTRYIEEHFGQTWEIDIFFGDNEGLVMAEAELPSEDTPLTIPDWVIKEVSDDRRYFNSCLQKNPYKNWK